MSHGPSQHPISVRTISGEPSFAAVDALEREMRVEAGMSARSHAPVRRSSTAFHVAVGAHGAVLGVASTTVGHLADLPIGLALRASGVTVTDEVPLPGPVCELVSIAVDPVLDTDGVTELLYRAFYRRARTSAALSLAVNVDAWLVDVLQEQYGVPFEMIGPPLQVGDRELLPVGGRLDELEEAVAATAPQFLAFLNEGLGTPG